MGFYQRQNEDEIRERSRAFWAGSSMGRPALHITAEKKGTSKTKWHRTEMSLKEREMLPEWHVMMNLNDLNTTEYLAEAMPCAFVNWGARLVTVACVAGGDYEYHGLKNGFSEYEGDGDSAWIKPIPDIFERPLPAFNKAHPIVRFAEESFRKVAKAIGNAGFINPPPFLDAMTTLSMFLEPERLCYELLDNPDKVKMLTGALTDVYIDTYDYFYNLIKSLGYDGSTSSWLGAMAEGKVEAVQCDFAVMLSPEMFDEFVMPDLSRTVEYMDYSLYHLDGTCQMRFLDSLRTMPKLNGIQWNPEPPAGSPVLWIDAFKEIRRRNFSLQVNCTEVSEAVQLVKELGPDGLLIMLPKFSSVEEAEKAISEIEKAC